MARLAAYELRSIIDRRLDALSPRSDGASELDAAIRYALLAPGKRLRPLLSLLAARELGAADLRALDAGCALEMVHAASLILDDLPCMDDAPVRRGQPSTHRAFSEEVAVLAAVTLLTRAFAVLGATSDVAADGRARLVTILADAVGSDGLAGGQYRDLRQAKARPPLGSLTDANHRKTGTLFVAAVRMAGAVSGAAEERIDELQLYAAHLGQAFQIMDDLQDGPCDAGTFPFEDAGKVTMLSLLDRDGARRRLDAHLREAIGALRPESDLAIFTADIFEAAVSRKPAQTCGMRV